MLGDYQNCLNYYAQAYDTFNELQDTLFMLLSSRLVCQFCQFQNVNNEFSKEFDSIYNALVTQPLFKDVRTDLLFENFDRRIELARLITKGLQDIEGTMRDDQFKSGM